MIPITLTSTNKEELELRVKDLKDRGYKVVTPPVQSKHTDSKSGANTHVKKWYARLQRMDNHRSV